MNHEIPKRVGLMELLGTSGGSQFVIPVYQRNYTWTAEREVKQYLNDLKRVLRNDYKNHFLGILIYLTKKIDFSFQELSVIDGQQRLTTTFLTIYAVREMFKSNGELDRVKQLEDQFLTNPNHKDKIKYKLKPLVADDDVYRCIIEDRLSDNNNKNSLIYNNYIYIKKYLTALVAEGFSLNDILTALNKLYIVCIPITEEDDAQKIFESINATGIKLTSADLIRNFILMNLDSETQDRFYSDYWRKIEENISTNSKELEVFFRMYLAIKTFNLVSRNSVYRNFVSWVEDNRIETSFLFKELLDYAKIYFTITKTDINNLPSIIKAPITDFRKMKSDLALFVIMEFFKLYNTGLINSNILGKLIQSINIYLLRRSICDMNSQNISRLFPSILRKILEKCTDNYENIVDDLNLEMVVNNARTSGSYMPTDIQLHDALIHANVYGRPALRIIFDRLELNNNPAPVDLSKLSIEHLMPQSPSEQWLKELNVTQEIYMENLHRLGNLTLASKPDNSKMSNKPWNYKNDILNSTAHLKMNMELLNIPQWTIKNIENRTESLIKQICSAFPYPNIKPQITYSNNDIVDIEAGCRNAISLLPSNAIEIRHNKVYTTDNAKKGYVLLNSKVYPEGTNKKFWFGYRINSFETIKNCIEKYFILICRSDSTLIIKLPKDFIDSLIAGFNMSVDSDGNVMHYHLVIHKNANGKTTILISRPILKKIDISQYVIAEI